MLSVIVGQTELMLLGTQPEDANYSSLKEIHVRLYIQYHPSPRSFWRERQFSPKAVLHRHAVNKSAGGFRPKKM